MKAKSLEALLSWYRQAQKEGLPVPYAQGVLKERVSATRCANLDLRLGEAACLFGRLEKFLAALPAAQCKLLLAEDPEEQRARLAFYKRRLRLLNTLRPAFSEAGLLPANND